MALEALNDLAKIRLEEDPYGLSSEEKPTAESGILESLPDKFNYFGFNSFAFERSFMAKEDLEELYYYWNGKLGKRVYWTALSERGNIIEENGQKFAFVKLTALIACGDADSKGRNVHSNGSGSFNL
jgi:hypothetical protein